MVKFGTGNGLSLSLIAACFLLPCVESTLDVTYGKWWKEFLTSEAGNAWFIPWNNLMQAKFAELAAIAEAQDRDIAEPFRVVMVGDSTMRHQWGALCGFLGENTGRRFDPAESQQGSPGCCIDTISKADGGGRGLCFELEGFRFLNPERVIGGKRADAYYFGCGLHLLHMVPTYPGSHPMEPLRVQEWLHYEKLLEATVEAVRREQDDDVRVAFMTTHVIADQLYTADFAAVRDAYRLEGGNSTIRAMCESQVGAAATGDTSDFTYFDWRGARDISAYSGAAEGEFTVDTYCDKALMDRRGSLHLNRRARAVMQRMGVPIVDAASIVEGQAWASSRSDGRHYHPIVPLEVVSLLEVLTSSYPSSESASGSGVGNESRDEGQRVSFSRGAHP